MSATITVTKRKTRRQHRGVVAGFIDDLIKPGWQDWMEIKEPVYTHDVIFGLTPLRWGQLADRAKTIQEREIALALGDHSTVAEVAKTLGLSTKRVEQVARGLFDRIAKPPAGRQIDMFEDDDGGDA